MGDASSDQRSLRAVDAVPGLRAVDAVPGLRAVDAVPGLRAMIARHQLGAFWTLAYLFSWAYWLPVIKAGGHQSHFPGLLGPLLAAFTLSLVLDGAAGVRRLWSRMVRWRVSLRWYLAALIPLATGLVGVVGVALVQQAWPAAKDLSTMPGLPDIGFIGLFVMVLVVNGYGEEAGWRGFAWVRLRQRHSLVGAAGLLGLVWAGWHLPVFWMDTGMRNLEWFVIPGWIIGLMAGSLVLGWLYEQAQSSLLIVALFHTFLNLASATPATEGFPAAITSVAVVAWSIVLLKRKVGPAPGNTSPGVSLTHPTNRPHRQ